MTVQALCAPLSLTPHCLSRPEAEVTGGYCGDLLSWVMGRAEPGHAWFTIMSNPNVAAVAVLTEVSCIILAEGVTPDPALLDRAAGQGLNLLSTPLSTYEAAAALARLL